jgi:hypothetical protein
MERRWLLPMEGRHLQQQNRPCCRDRSRKP